MIALRASALRLLILLLAIANGALREFVLLHAFDRSTAYVLSGTLLMACIVGIAWFGLRRLGPLRPWQAAAIGVFWLTLTLAFEFGFGLLVRHVPLEALLDAYRFKDGSLWPLVLVVLTLAPAACAHRR